MRLTFYGAAGEVTGSCYLLETGRARVLIDFGLHQGGARAERRNRRLPAAGWDRLDAVVLSHAHLDHSGRLPLLPRAGFTGRVWATPATVQLTDLLLKDAANIQEMDAVQTTRFRERTGRRPAAPLYTLRDVGDVMRQMSSLPYGEPKEIADGVTLRFTDAGHILGSASIELRIREQGNGGAEKVIVFSADIGLRGTPLLKDPAPPAGGSADVVVLESTYGDRDHRPLGATLDELVTIIAQAQADNGKVLIPAFAIGRTQSLIYHLGEMIRAGKVTDARVYVDSPMAIAATELYRNHRPLFDEHAWEIISRGGAPLNFPSLHYVRSGEESRALNRAAGGTIIIAASGMLTGGRIMHHLKHSLWKPQTHLVFVGFQAEGSLGRRLIEGAKHVNVLRAPIAVKSQVHTLGGFSAHAGQAQLMDWARAYTASAGAASKPRFLLTHGEDRPRAALAQAMQDHLGVAPHLPTFGETVEL